MKAFVQRIIKSRESHSYRLSAPRSQAKFSCRFIQQPEGGMMPNETITIKSADGLEFDAYVSRKDDQKRPVVIVIQEIFGVNAWLRSIADWLAGEGFIAVAPDLFHRQEKGIQL